MKGLIITGIHTEVGKTRVAATLAAGLGWHYWKPIQTGSPADTDTVRQWGIPTYPERYRLALPAAPLVAAQAENRPIDWACLTALPLAEPLIIEGAGGLYVPITETHFMIDLFATWELPVVLVVRPYLGAMNHTWLSLLALRERKIPLVGIVLNGLVGDPSESYFEKVFQPIGKLPWYGGAFDPWRAFEESGLAESLHVKGYLSG